MALTVPLSEIVERSNNRLLGKHESWGRVSLGDVATVLNGFAFKSSEFSNSGGVPLIRIRDVGKDRSETTYLGEYDPRYFVEPGDLLLGMDGDFNCARWRGPRGLLNQRVCKITLKSDIYVPKFLDYTLPGYLKAINDVTSSVTVKHLSSKTIEEIPLPLPPIEVQLRLVAEIEKQFSRLDEAVANLKRVKANLKRYKVAVLKAAVEGKLTEDWRKQHPAMEPASKLLEHILATRRAEWNGRGKYKEPTPPDTNDLPFLPKGWTWATVEQLAAGFAGAIQSGPFGSQLLHSEFVDDGILAIGIDNVLDGKFSLGRQHRITPAKFEILKKFEARPRDVVITVMATVGRVCVLPQSLERAIITKHCYRITPVPGNVDPDFLAIVLRADSSTRQYIFGNVRGQTRPGINGSILKAAPVSLPAFAEQKEIVAETERRLSVIEDLEASVEANLIRADRLRQSVLSRAFEGKLVPQSPSDEPASAFLSRLHGASALKDSLQPKDTRKPGGTTMPKPKAEHSGEIGRMNTKSLYHILRDSEKRLTPEQLFANAGFGPELIDEFYEELKRETQAGRILQERPNNTAVYLKAISNANR